MSFPEGQKSGSAYTLLAGILLLQVRAIKLSNPEGWSYRKAINENGQSLGHPFNIGGALIPGFSSQSARTVAVPASLKEFFRWSARVSKFVLTSFTFVFGKKVFFSEKYYIYLP